MIDEESFPLVVLVNIIAIDVRRLTNAIKTHRISLSLKTRFESPNSILPVWIL